MIVVPEGQLAVGVQLPVQSQSRIFAERWERSAGVDEIVAVTRAADELGFFYVGVCDHVAIPAERVPQMGAVWYDPIATLAYLAALTTRVRLLTHVLVLPVRSPLLAAKQLATLDVLSGGRVVVGVGAGHVAEEFAALGADFAGRGRALDAAIDELRGAFDREDLAVAPAPAQAALPIWVGGSSPAALRRAAERGDGWIPQGTPREQMPEQVAAIRAQRGDEPLDLGAMAEPLYVGTPAWDVGRWTLTGSGDEHAERLRWYGELGCSHVQVKLRSRSVDELLEQMALFAADVLPQLKR